MAFTAGHRTLFHFYMAFLALLMVGHTQTRLAALGLERVTLGARPILGTLTLNFLAVLIDVMADGAVFGLGLLIMRIMVENADGTFQFSKSVNLQIRVFLGKSRNTT
jgi:hypothetical protein